MPLGFGDNRSDPVPMQVRVAIAQPDYTEFDLVSDAEVISGAQQRFTPGTFKGKTFHDVPLENPSQYVKLSNAKKISEEASEFVAWVEAHYHLNKKTYEITARVSGPEHGAASSSGQAQVRRPCPGGC